MELRIYLVHWARERIIIWGEKYLYCTCSEGVSGPEYVTTGTCTLHINRRVASAAVARLDNETQGVETGGAHRYVQTAALGDDARAR